jgi:hypothetical protein
MVRRRLAGVAVAAAVSAFGAVPAHAACVPAVGRCVAGSYQYIGGCSFTADNQDSVTGPDTYVGYLGARVVTLHDGVPAPATVTCDLRVNGGRVDTLSAAGPGVEAGAKPTTFVAAPFDDVVSLCTTVDYGGGVTDSECADSVDPNPPPCCFDPFFYDAIVCPVLVALAGTYGPVTVGPDGDVTVDPDPLAIGWLYDCPPYRP